MGLFTCKHKNYTIIKCDEMATSYTCKCIKCNHQFILPKAIGDVYVIGSIIKRSKKMER